MELLASGNQDDFSDAVIEPGNRYVLVIRVGIELPTWVGPTIYDVIAAFGFRNPSVGVGAGAINIEFDA